MDMSRILPVNNRHGEPIGAALSIHSLARLLEHVSPGRYLINEIGHDPLPRDHTSRRWGIAVMRSDSSVSIARQIWHTIASTACDDRFTWP